MTEPEGLAAIVAMRARIGELEPDAPAAAGWGEPWTSAELDAFEGAHGCTLPPGYRAFLASVGDGGPGPGLGLVPLRGRDAEQLAKLGRRFPLDRGWVTPAIRDQLDGEGLLDDYADYLYELPEGVAADDGTLLLGAAEDHRGLLLVVTGEGAGQVWLDNRGNDFEEMLPAGHSFVELLSAYFERELEQAESRARFAALVEQGDLGTLRETLGAEALEQRFGDVFAAQREPEPAPVSPALAQMIALHYADRYGTAGQALAIGGCWEELEARCQHDLVAFAAGELEPAFRAEATLHAHLAVAQVALGRPGPVPDYTGGGGGYWHLSSALVPLVISRWDDDEAVGAVFARLRTDVALEFLAWFPAPALARRSGWVRQLGEGWLDVLVAGGYPAGAGSMGSHVTKIVERLLETDAGDDVLHTWFWLAACTTSKKSYAKLVAAAGQRHTPRFADKAEARAALDARSPGA